MATRTKGSSSEFSFIQRKTFKDISLEPDETFPGFCNKVKREAKHCAFKCDSPTCTAESTAIRDQIIIGTSNNNISEEALLRDWNLTDLCQKGMAMESAARGGIEIAGETLNRVGQYSYNSLLKSKQSEKARKPTSNQRVLSCFYCGNNFSTSIDQHRSRCSARNMQEMFKNWTFFFCL
ncbi:hypothetical protein LOTGIDRAFT_166042 [Lottia gigantea]|uniref:Uncharacterized protein n=1 Tax=Lottia gigantea TaxID=225164 RepID=V4A448_LOTGI|nr:hypothetical protein LOTGIDRAFT_166042 [Lottia gigantea]ESO88021.1 hypothetical protein LOTGIDRAFT_166042 [Lottia gigantea]